MVKPCAFRCRPLKTPIRIQADTSASSYRCTRDMEWWQGSPSLKTSSSQEHHSLMLRKHVRLRSRRLRVGEPRRAIQTTDLEPSCNVVRISSRPRFATSPVSASAVENRSDLLMLHLLSLDAQFSIPGGLSISSCFDCLLATIAALLGPSRCAFALSLALEHS